MSWHFGKRGRVSEGAKVQRAGKVRKCVTPAAEDEGEQDGM